MRKTWAMPNDLGESVDNDKYPNVNLTHGHKEAQKAQNQSPLDGTDQRRMITSTC